MIDNETKRKLVYLSQSGVRYEDIYNQYVKPLNTMSFRSFRRRMAEWKVKVAEDEQLLESANLSYKFSPYASTVQVNGKGVVVQAWIKQRTEECIEEILRAIKDNTPVAQICPTIHEQAEGMLEIPLFDMHFGIANIDFYRPILEEILAIVTSRHWDTIVIPVGQDLIHNDSISKGVTTKGTLIEKVNLTNAIKDAEAFYFNLIDAALRNANVVKVIYSAGNHDKTVGWLFARILKARYGDIVDDSTKERKVVWWNGCFIGITHGDKHTDNPNGLRGKFTVEFPALFATARVREIHTGHLHREDSKDEYGVMVRRVSCGNKNDDWTTDEGWKSQKRFMLFEYAPCRLKSIHYVYNQEVMDFG